MKKIIFILLFPVILKAQVTINEVKKTSFEVGHVKRPGVWATLNATVYDNSKDTIYALCMQNQKYQQITSIECVSFAASSKEFNDVYKAFKSCFEKENKINKDYQINMKLGEKAVRISPNIDAVFGGLTLRIESAYTSLSEKHVDLLFGKRK